jgi:hypothetical protein
VVFAVAGQSVTEGGQTVTVWTLEVKTVEVIYSCPELETLLDPESTPEPEFELDPESLPDVLVKSPDFPGLDSKRLGVVGEDKRAVVQGHTVCQLVLVKVTTALVAEILARSKVLVKKERVNRMPDGYGGRSRCS